MPVPSSLPADECLTFWQYSRPDGTLGALDDLRRELYERKVVNLADARRVGA